MFRSFYKIIQRRVYTILGTNVGLLIFLGFLYLILHEIIGLIRPPLSSVCKGSFCSHINYHDNIGNIDMQDKMSYGPIDVVFTWVNGSDPVWLAKKEAYRQLLLPSDARLNTSISEAAGSNRYRDNDELRYSLRSIEKYAPWVRHIYLVTDNQIPNWLNVAHPRLTVISHADIFPNKSHLPVFSSPAIESHLHRIRDLSRLFLYFNDDVLLGSPTLPEDFISVRGVQKLHLSWEVPKCAPGCSDNWIGDGYCDKACNVSSCNFDFPDCINGSTPAIIQSEKLVKSAFCSKGCPDGWLGDRVCDMRCRVPECAYDVGDCGISLITSSYRGIRVHHENSHFFTNESLEQGWRLVGSNGADVNSHISTPIALTVPVGTMAVYINVSSLACRAASKHSHITDCRGSADVPGFTFTAASYSSVNPTSPTVHTAILSQFHQALIVTLYSTQDDRPALSASDFPSRTTFTVTGTYRVPFTGFENASIPMKNHTSSIRSTTGTSSDSGSGSGGVSVHYGMVFAIEVVADPVITRGHLGFPDGWYPPHTPAPPSGYRKMMGTIAPCLPSPLTSSSESGRNEGVLPILRITVAERPYFSIEKHTEYAGSESGMLESYIGTDREWGGVIVLLLNGRSRLPFSSIPTSSLSLRYTLTNKTGHSSHLTRPLCSAIAKINETSLRFISAYSEGSNPPCPPTLGALLLQQANERTHADILLQFTPVPVVYSASAASALSSREIEDLFTMSVQIPTGFGSGEWLHVKAEIVRTGTRSADEMIACVAGLITWGMHSTIPTVPPTPSPTFFPTTNSTSPPTPPPVAPIVPTIDTYAGSLIHVNRLYSKTFGSEMRKVPAHMPHLIDRHTITALQARFPLEFNETSTHRFRSHKDMQYSFSYYYYLIGREKEMGGVNSFELSDFLSRSVDTDGDGVLGKNEMLTLADIVLNRSPKEWEMEELVTCCFNSSHSNSSSTSSAANIPGGSPTITQVLSCPRITTLLKANIHWSNRYPTHSIGTDKDIAFEMIGDNITETTHQLDSIRARQPKFICINDNIQTSDTSLLEALGKVLNSFFVSFFPMKSGFELRTGESNPTLYWDEYQAKYRVKLQR